MFRRIQSVGSGATEGSTARRPPSLGRAKGRGAASRAFTLIELLVVVTIIIILIAILLPALGMAMSQAKVAKTQSLMNNLVSAIDTYYTRFHGYPGPVPAANTTVAGNKISGSQNMLLGLSYSVVASGGNPPLLSGGGVKTMQPTGPLDNASTDALGNPLQYPPFFTPTSKQIAIISGAVGNSFAFPVAVDAFTDGLPILYYRRTVGVETPAVAATGAAYCLNENVEYTSATALVSTSGTTYNETLSAFSTTDLTPDVTVNGGTNVHGGYVLISAGLDRYWGKYNGKTDDIVQVGGD